MAKRAIRVGHKPVACELAALACAILLATASSIAAQTADLPKSAQAVLSKLKIPADVLSGLDKELEVPNEWIEGARAAPLVKISGSDEPPLHGALVRPFLERYPFLKIDYQRGSANDRVIKPLIAYAEGRYLADVVRSMDGSISEFEKLGAAENLRVLPTYNNVVSGAHYESGLGVAYRARPYCMAFNTNLVKKEQLPGAWKDLPDAAILANRRLAAVMLPHLWFMPLWGKYGEAWATQYLDDFFAKLQPQIRMEGINATTSLVGAGENFASLPAYPERIKEQQLKGSPVAWHCPDMVPLEFSKMAIFRASPGHFGALLYANWLLSKEGQLSQFAVFGTSPVHRDLQRPDFYVFPDEMRGKPFISYDDPKTTDRFLAMWDKHVRATQR